MKTIFKSVIIGSTALAMMAASPAAFAGETLEIRDFIGTITWSNGPLSVEATKNTGDTQISGRSSILVEGGIEKINGRDCGSSYGRYDLNWFGKRKEGRIGGYKNLEEYPELNITLPRDATLLIQNSVVFTDGTPDISNVELELRHCGNVTLGNIENTLALDGRGSADVTVANTGQIVASLRGSGDLEGGNSGDVLIESHGSGDIDLDDLASLEISLHGSGDLEVGDIVGTVDISSHGSGDVDLNHVKGGLSYSGHGSGDFDASSVSGAKIYLKSHGSGDVDIGGGEVGSLDITARGSATIEYSGEAETANLQASGSGDIFVEHVLGDATLKTSGSGDIDIDQRG